MPRVSVIMGVYNINDKEVLQKAIMSILGQTFSDFEFIICDDGSTNNVLEMVKDIAGNDKRIKIIQNEKNKGLAYTLNKCLEVATGEYIARMDADDISEKDRFEQQIKILDEKPEVGLVSSNIYFFNEQGIWGEKKYSEKIKVDDFLYNNPIAHGSIMARKTAFDKVNGYRDIKMTYRVEDYDMLMRMYAQNIKMITIQKPLYGFREDENAINRRKFKYRINEMKVRYYGFKNLGLLKKIKNYIYVVKPIVVGILPKKMYKKLKK